MALEADKEGSSEKQFEAGAKTIPFALTPPQALELAQKLTKLANKLHEPRAGEVPN